MIGGDVSDYVHADDRQLLLDYCNVVQPTFSSSESTSCSAHCTGQSVTGPWSVSDWSVRILSYHWLDSNHSSRHGYDS